MGRPFSSTTVPVTRPILRVTTIFAPVISLPPVGTSNGSSAMLRSPSVAAAIVQSSGNPVRRKRNGPPSPCILKVQSSLTCTTRTVGSTLSLELSMKTRTPDTGNGGAPPSSVAMVPVTVLPVRCVSTTSSTSAPLIVRMTESPPEDTL